MQEVELTPQLLKDFSLNFAKVPNVNLDGLEHIPFDVRIVAAWTMELANTGQSSYFEIFQAYLCGRGLFLEQIDNLPMQEFHQMLGLIVRESIEKLGKTIEQVNAEGDAMAAAARAAATKGNKDGS